MIIVMVSAQDRKGHCGTAVPMVQSAEGQAAALNAEASTAPHAAGPGGRTFLGANGAIGPPIGRAAAPTTVRRPSGFAAPGGGFDAPDGFDAPARSCADVQPP